VPDGRHQRRGVLDQVWVQAGGLLDTGSPRNLASRSGIERALIASNAAALAVSCVVALL